MDWLSIFRRSPEKQVERLRKKVKEPHGDPAVRINAAQRLLEIGTAESYRAVLDRFQIHVSPSRQDEEEKEELLQWLVSVGADIVPAAISFLKSERQVYWPAEILKRILPREQIVARMNEVLRYHWENPPASPDPKAQLIRALEDLRTPELEQTVQRYLEDDDDDVVLACLDYLFAADNEDAHRDAVLECYFRCEDRPRVRSWILQRLVEKRWKVRGFRGRFEESMPEGFALTREGAVIRIGARG